MDAPDLSRNDPEKRTKFSERFRLGACTFSMKTQELLDASGNAVHLRSQSAEVLAYLLRQHGGIVSKADLFRTVWAGAHVTDDSLVQCISDIRRALKDDKRQIIQTLPKKGYRAFATPLPNGPELEAPPLPSRPSIAVLPFDDYSVGEDESFLSDAIAEGVIGELSRFSELFVIARNSSFEFRDMPANVARISKLLGVRYLLEGTQRKDGNRLRVTVRLIDAIEGHNLWSEVFTRDLADLFTVQDEIVRAVVATVAQKVIGVEGRKANRSDVSKLTALLHHLKARLDLIQFTPDGNQRAREANLASIRAEPTQPFGYAGLAFVHINGYRWGWTDLPRATALEEARRAARKAMELAPDYYDGHAAMAYVHLEQDDLDRAIARARHVLTLNPNDTSGMCDLAEFLGYDGQIEEAQHLLRRAMRLDPLHPDWFRWNLAWLQWLGGEFASAAQTMNAMSEIPPMAFRVLAVIEMDLGQPERARRAIARLLEWEPDYSLAKARRYYRGKFRNLGDLERMMTGLRKAGLPS